jgi:hypothetical protein
MSRPFLAGYVTDVEYAGLLRQKTGYGTRKTLWRWRRLGVGPKWVKIGRAVLYQVDQDFEPASAAKAGAR